MKTLKITRARVYLQMEKDMQMEKRFADSFYSIRVSECKAILKNGHGVFSVFKNEQIMVIITEQ